MKRVLVTGASGFIGRHCLPMLLEKGYQVHAVVPAEALKLDLPEVHWHVADLLEVAGVPAMLEKVQASHLLHFAWVTTPGIYWSSPENLRWLQTSLELLRNFKAYGGQRVLMAGSCAEYDWRFGYCSENITPLLPGTLYGICKVALSRILMSFADREDLSAAWGRIFFLYGPHENPERLVPAVINALLEDSPALCTHGGQIRDYLYVKDVASAFVALLDSEVEGAVNIASGRPIELKEIILRIADLLGRPEMVRLGAIPVNDSEPPLLVADAQRLAQELGWHPAYDLDEGLAETIAWWKEQKGP